MFATGRDYRIKSGEEKTWGCNEEKDKLWEKV